MLNQKQETQMLVNQIRSDMMSARKTDDAVAKSLLVTLYAETVRVGKDKRNGETTDDEAVTMIKKFATNCEETQRLLEARGQSATVQRRELEILRAYLPEQLSRDELEQSIHTIVAELPEKSAKVMGKVMAELKARHGSTYDGKLASELVKEALVSV
jgi:uncharacterized protein